MYNIEGKKIIFEDNKLFSMLPSLGYGSQGDVYKFRLDKEFYALKVFNGLNIEYLENYEQKLNINIAFIISESPFVNKMYYELYKFGINKVYTIEQNMIKTEQGDYYFYNHLSKYKEW